VENTDEFRTAEGSALLQARAARVRECRKIINRVRYRRFFIAEKIRTGRIRHMRGRAWYEAAKFLRESWSARTAFRLTRLARRDRAFSTQREADADSGELT
jgi:hypothetical protein